MGGSMSGQTIGTIGGAAIGGFLGGPPGAIIGGTIGGSTGGALFGSPEEDLQKSILDDLEGSRKLQQEFLPLLLQTAGYQYDENGNLAQMDYGDYLESLNPLMRKQFENFELIQDRMGAALRGEGAVSQALEANIASQEAQLEESLARRLGPNWGLSSPGILAKQNFQKNAELLREEARNAAINTYSNLGYRGSELYGLTPPAQIQQAQSIANFGYTGTPYRTDMARLQQQGQSSLFQGLGQLGGIMMGQGATGTSQGLGLSGLFGNKLVPQTGITATGGTMGLTY